MYYKDFGRIFHKFIRKIFTTISFGGVANQTMVNVLGASVVGPWAAALKAGVVVVGYVSQICLS